MKDWQIGLATRAGGWIVGTLFFLLLYNSCVSHSYNYSTVCETTVPMFGAPGEQTTTCYHSR
jgi:hypothetical protein